MKRFKHFLKMTLFSGIVLAMFTNCTTRVVYTSRTAPPSAKVEVVTVKPYSGAVWVNGRWAWKNGHYVWKKGYWVKGRKGYVWVPGHWKKTNRGWVWKSGKWRRV